MYTHKIIYKTMFWLLINNINKILGYEKYLIKIQISQQIDDKYKLKL